MDNPKTTTGIAVNSLVEALTNVVFETYGGSKVDINLAFQQVVTDAMEAMKKK